MNIDYTLLITGVKVKCLGIVTPKVHDLLVAFLSQFYSHITLFISLCVALTRVDES